MTKRVYALFANQGDATYFAENWNALGAAQSDEYPIEEERKAGLLTFTKECAGKLQDLLKTHGPLNADKLLKDGLMHLSRVPKKVTKADTEEDPSLEEDVHTDFSEFALTPFGLDVEQDDANIYIRSGQLIER